MKELTPAERAALIEEANECLDIVEYHLQYMVFKISQRERLKKD